MTNQSRKSPRAKFLDYNQGAYFITICTKNKIHYFGEIYNEEMHMNEIGKIVAYELSNPQVHYPHIEIPLFVIMPNHIHAIIMVNDPCRDESNHTDLFSQRTPNPVLRDQPDMSRHVPTLSQYILSMKGAVTKQACKINPSFAWQPRYHDHFIRGHKDNNKITEYIENNVLRWDKDCFNEKGSNMSGRPNP